MTTKTENHQLDSELTLHDRTLYPLPIHAITLSLTTQDDELIECRLTFQVNPELYQRIDTEALFNLKPQVRNPLSAGEFLPEPDIKIETTLAIAPSGIILVQQLLLKPPLQVQAKKLMMQSSTSSKMGQRLIYLKLPKKPLPRCLRE